MHKYGVKLTFYGVDCDVIADHFVVRGRDRDGNTIFVSAHQKSGEIRGLSVVYSRSRLSGIAEQIIASFEPFPDQPNTTQVARAPTTPQAPLARSSPIAAAPSSPAAATLEVDRLKKEMAKMRTQLAEQEREREERELREKIRQEERAKVRRELQIQEESRAERRQRASAEAERRKKFEQEMRDGLAKLHAKREQVARLERTFKLPPGAGGVATAQIPDGKRVAFVVGINKYARLGKNQQLRTAVNDAETIATAFRTLGFEVTEVARDVNLATFYEKWQRFLNSIEKGGMAAFFYAGHGIQINGTNYLLPSDAPPPEIGQAEYLVNLTIDFNRL